MSNKHLSVESLYLYADHMFGFENCLLEIKKIKPASVCFFVFCKIFIGNHFHRLNE